MKVVVRISLGVAIILAALATEAQSMRLIRRQVHHARAHAAARKPQLQARGNRGAAAVSEPPRVHDVAVLTGRGARGSTRAPSQAPLAIHVVAFHRDEDALLEDWMMYHAHLFGVRNIHVWDDNSTDPEVVATLAAWKERGADIRVLPEDVGFMVQGDYTTLGLKNAIDHEVRRSRRPPDFVVPLDIDEFLVADLVGAPGGATSYRTSRVRVMSAFRALDRSAQLYKMATSDTSSCGREDSPVGRLLPGWRHAPFGGGGHPVPAYEDIPTTPGRRWARQLRMHGPPHLGCGAKVFFTGEGFISTSMGNHIGLTVANQNKDLSPVCTRDGKHFKPQCADMFGTLSCYEEARIGIIHYSSFPFLDTAKKKVRCGTRTPPLAQALSSATTGSVSQCPAVSIHCCHWLLALKFSNGTFEEYAAAEWERAQATCPGADREASRWDPEGSIADALEAIDRGDM
eukprot:CAMPEP_0182864686 /NCGR_PEP_ID=MMETSP0034_2-20130328/7296_1 /TAXON_ID=156128 /ORGANISM="Nephroselmis pyriformis, Strain CCMP717" /LENGTH=456 /DNA_ID=CAMNT_0024996947 /DNA_START=68 /DNA_END=1438 /DNA_ORIENTATION=+